MKPTWKIGRQPRRNFNDAGHAHFLTFSCYQRYPFLATPRACDWLANSIESARMAMGLDVWAYVFMPNHAHILVHPRRPDYDIAIVRKVIKQPVAKTAIAYLKEHSPEWLVKVARPRGRRVEHLFWQSGGGHNRNVTSGEVLEAMVEYIHMNPVRRGLVERARDWKWSSAAWYEDRSEVPIPVDPIPPEWLQIVTGSR